MKRFIFGPTPRASLIRAIGILGSALLIFGFLLLPVRLQGISMLPTYQDGAFNFANRLAFLMRDPARGDVVAIRMAGTRVMYVKRIVGLPGERLEIANGIVLVNGFPQVESFVLDRAPWNVSPFTLGEDEYFVVGDNRRMLVEDHDFGRVARERIVGKLLL